MSGPKPIRAGSKPLGTIEGMEGRRRSSSSVKKPMLSTADDDELFPDGWLTTHLDALMDELASRPPEFWPRLTGPRAEAQAAIDADLRARRHSIMAKRTCADCGHGPGEGCGCPLEVRLHRAIRESVRRSPRRLQDLIDELTPLFRTDPQHVVAAVWDLVGEPDGLHYSGLGWVSSIGQPDGGPS